MSESNTRKRNLPSWMSSREEESDARNRGKSKDQSVFHHESRGEGKSASGTSSGDSDISKLMEGIVFVLSGFVNPERGVLRSQMLEMGAEYQPDWNVNCTLLVCAFANTPKFRQVKADGGTIISKDWISECYNQRKLIDIETYLLHAGKPWRKQSFSQEATRDVKPSTTSKPLKQEEKVLHSGKTTGSSKMKGWFPASKVKKWAVEDLKRTISWLESQDEKPEPGQINKVAAEGILTCIQDAIDALQQGQGMQQVTEQWGCVPRVVEELARFDCNKDASSLPSKDDLWREAMASKEIYRLEFLIAQDNEFLNKRSPQNHESKKAGKTKENDAADEPSYDSDATIEMTEDEIDQAYNMLTCSL